MCVSCTVQGKSSTGSAASRHQKTSPGLSQPPPPPTPTPHHFPLPPSHHPPPFLRHHRPSHRRCTPAHRSFCITPPLRPPYRAAGGTVRHTASSSRSTRCSDQSSPCQGLLLHHLMPSFTKHALPPLSKQADGGHKPLQQPHIISNTPARAAPPFRQPYPMLPLLFPSGEFCSCQ